MNKSLQGSGLKIVYRVAAESMLSDQLQRLFQERCRLRGLTKFGRLLGTVAPVCHEVEDLLSLLFVVEHI